MAAQQRPQFNLEERVFMVVKYHELRSPGQVIRQFRERFPNRRPPFRHTVTRHYGKYMASGTSKNLNSGHSGRLRIVLQKDPN